MDITKSQKMKMTLNDISQRKLNLLQVSHSGAQHC